MRKGFTLIEILVALAVMAVLLLAFTRFFGGTLTSASSLQVQNELLGEGEIAHQLIASRVKEAWYIFPKGSTLTLTSSGWTASNSIDGGHQWTVGDHFLALILPPKTDGTKCSEDNAGCFRFFAYYPQKRSWYVTHAGAAEALDPDPLNDGKVWVLMEYRAYYRGGCPVTGSGQPDPGNTGYRGKRARLLVDYVQPNQDPWDSSYDYHLFELPSDPTPEGLAVGLRLVRKTRRRLYRVPSGPAPFTLSVEAQNVGVKADPAAPYCQ